jgi:hypothetical protein
MLIQNYALVSKTYVKHISFNYVLIEKTYMSIN